MMSERRKVLTMLHENKIDVDEAEGLLDALEYAPEQVPEPKVEYITANPKTQKVLDYARKAASSSAPVMIVGESGTGKVVLARLIHQESGRRDKPFVYVNCMSLPEILFEADLFGYERGAFTGANQRMEGFIEQANGGTLFLDSIDELPMSLQVKLLPFVKTGEFRRMGSTEMMQADVRLVSITNKDLQIEIQAGRFSQDLYDCLSVIGLDIPPLRERAEDIPLLANYFVRDYVAQSGRSIPAIAPEAMDVLTAYAWPGNVRELSRVIQSALVLCDGDTIEVKHLPDALTGKGK
jgi:DNA-binding NtrC family response regulator